ncbi:hypothetical protein H5410_055568 [Solanum commersonii]|uniref:Uncharacterized protein n=1 Tax=Solanum commersonii TaxID=4109 RepID=A0A9J5WIN8_SOLCO|nr:hypothetical protein H5410_055568 [Solanum commersonii]
MSEKDFMGRKIKKGNPWEEDEHRAFLKGLDFHGKGNWAKVTKDFLPSRTSIKLSVMLKNTFSRTSRRCSDLKTKQFDAFAIFTAIPIHG